MDSPNLVEARLVEGWPVILVVTNSPGDPKLFLFISNVIRITMLQQLGPVEETLVKAALGPCSEDGSKEGSLQLATEEAM